MAPLKSSGTQPLDSAATADGGGGPVTERRRAREVRSLTSYKMLPVLFIIVVMVILTVAYLVYHCMTLMQLNVDDRQRNKGRAQRGTIQFIVFSVVAVLWAICYARCILTLPGTIPNTPDFMMGASDPTSQSEPQFPAWSPRETKKDGWKRRYCKWCWRFKPDRCHHCRTCDSCILKMDHHCPWIYNCVGYRNHKFFILLLFYSSLATGQIALTMPETLQESIQYDTPFDAMFLLMYGEVLAVCLFILVTAFLSFHFWLIKSGMTTIEYCEKSGRKNADGESDFSSAYCRASTYANFADVLGENFLLWLLPIRDTEPANGGILFVMDSTPLVAKGGTKKKKAKELEYDSGSDYVGPAGAP
mmetsp:Transcript_28046/g.72522  ORF Transcript_28046/g.72522 Transcript_28046/m.72522 type:complete len:360 (-) Transcript_28046:40-1119(-)